MRKLAIVLIGGALLGSGAVVAKLPPPTPEEQAKTAEKKANEQAQLEKEKALLERAQDRVAERYRKENGSRGSATTAQTSTDKLPKTAKEPTQGVGPKPGMPQSAEAHSGQVK